MFISKGKQFLQKRTELKDKFNVFMYSTFNLLAILP